MIPFLEASKKASSFISHLSSNAKNTILKEMANALEKNTDFILSKNDLDVQNGQQNNLNNALIDRLLLTKDRIKAMADAIKKIADLKDPIGKTIEGWISEDGLNIQKICVPIGVIGIIYESRPNVTSDTAALCFKSGNVCILKGGKEAQHSSEAIVTILQNVLMKNNVPKQVIALLPNYTREGIDSLIKEDTFVDLIIPRGGETLIKHVSKNSSIPVIKNDKGLCHTYIDKNADGKIAINIAVNAKCQRPSVCNAMETLLVHEEIAHFILPGLEESFEKEKTKLRGCPLTTKIIDIEPVLKEDYNTEYLDNILSIKIVKNVKEAVLHINQYGSRHSEAIISENYTTVNYFLENVDAAVVYANASTRFTDGEMFGFGAEVGISTNKLHARGPMGINDLTTYKYKILGNGQIRK